MSGVHDKMIPRMAEANGCVLLCQIWQISIVTALLAVLSKKGAQNIWFGNRWARKPLHPPIG